MSRLTATIPIIMIILVRKVMTVGNAVDSVMVDSGGGMLLQGLASATRLELTVPFAKVNIYTTSTRMGWLPLITLVWQAYFRYIVGFYEIIPFVVFLLY